MAVKPTPTQEENDRAAMGEHVVEKEADGSPEEESTVPPVGAAPEMKKKQMEAKEHPNPQQGYQTRASTPAPAREPAPAPAKKDSE